MKIRYYIISSFLSFILLAQSFTCDKEIANGDSIKPDRIKLSSYFPQQFSVDQLKALQSLKLSDSSHGQLELDDTNHKKLLATNPYRIQVWTGQWAGFAANIKIVPGSEQRLKPDQLRATYRFHSPYTTWNNADFDVVLNLSTIKIVSVTDSVLGDKDFLTFSGQPISNSSYFYIANTDKQFILDTPRALHRFNYSLPNWLLILKQLEGEDIHSLEVEVREQIKERLFKEYLQKKGFEFNSNGVLTVEQYIQINDELRSAILGYFRLTVADVPTLDYITQVGGLEDMGNGKFYFAVSTILDVAAVQAPGPF